jgi:hypothetical protein
VPVKARIARHFDVGRARVSGYGDQQNIAAEGELPYELRYPVSAYARQPDIDDGGSRPPVQGLIDRASSIVADPHLMTGQA